MTNNKLSEFIWRQRKKQDILLMTHLVFGYPSFADNEAMIAAMAIAEVELIELQIPFSEPMADGPVIMKANHAALANGVKLLDCLEFASRMSQLYPQIQFLFMTYYNVILAYGEQPFARQSAQCGIVGSIVPDLPLEESASLQEAYRQFDQSLIFIFTPTNEIGRLQQIASSAAGFIYTIGRRGVTGQKTLFDSTMSDLITRYRQATDLPLAMGFGIQNRDDVSFLTGKIDIAVIGSQLINIQKAQGVAAAQDFLCALRA